MTAEGIDMQIPDKYPQEEYCCSSCAQKRICHVCQDQTIYACSDCQIDFGITVYVCSKKECRDYHESKCGQALRERIASLTRENRELRELADECARWFEDEAQERRASGFNDTSTYLETVVKLGAQARAALQQAKESQ